MADAAPITVIETPQFLSAARRLMDDVMRAELVDHLARHPNVGDLVQGTGGVRKLRWRLEGRGKRGGARVIYFYYDLKMPLFLLTAYAKNERADLSQAERNDFKRLTKALIESYGKDRP
jgi:hypothetical protein